MRALTTEEKRTLTQRTNAHGLVRLAVLFGLLFTASAFIAGKGYYWPLFIPAQGLLLISLFHLQHECVHNTPFKTQKLNTAIGAICGFILFLPCEWFRYFHRDHHRYTQIPGKDPELDSPKPATKAQWLLHITGIPVFKSLLTVVGRCASGTINENYIPAKAKSSVVRQAQIMTICYVVLIVASIAMQNSTLLWVWVVPLIVGQPFLRLYLLAEHTLCENTGNMFLNTRTVLANPVVRWFTWNMPYHTEHHVYPGVPFHNLPQLHARMQSYLQHIDSSYTEFNKRHYKTLSGRVL